MIKNFLEILVLALLIAAIWTMYVACGYLTYMLVGNIITTVLASLVGTLILGDMVKRVKK